MVVADVEVAKSYKTYGRSGHFFRCRNFPPAKRLQIIHSCTTTITRPGRIRRAAMKAQPQNVRSRYLTTISTMEKVSPSGLECDNSSTETKWLWLLNAGDMAARARSGITEAQNLPGAPVQIVELLAKVSRESKDGRLTTKKWKSRMLSLSMSRLNTPELLMSTSPRLCLHMLRRAS